MTARRETAITFFRTLNNQITLIHIQYNEISYDYEQKVHVYLKNTLYILCCVKKIHESENKACFKHRNTF